jgi:error-prone DNA polymerase
MATFKSTGGVGPFRERLIAGMLRNGITEAFAERLVKQIEGFGSYGFPESHAASFAKIAYASSWMKCHHPDVFCAALLNAQPMGFYAPAQIVRDAREHGVVVRPVCVLESEWDTALLPATRTGRHPLRLGLRIVAGLSGADAGRLLTARARARFTSVEDLWRRSGVPLATLEKLARADAFHALGLDRRQALWAIRGLGEAPLPLLAGLERREEPVTLTRLTEGREVVEDYRATQMSLRAHPLHFLRQRLDERRIARCADLKSFDGKPVEVAGIILVRQRPGSAKGVLFITIEDETGVANGILWPDRFEAQRRTVMSAAMVGLKGRVQVEGAVIHIIVDRVTDLTAMLREVGDVDLPRLVARGDGATHPGAPDRGDPGWKVRPRSDYHFRDRGENDIPVQSHDFH